MMPAFKIFNDADLNALITFLYDEKTKDDKNEVAESTTKIQSDVVKWKISGYTKFLDSDGNPAVKPPWGTLNAIDLNTGEYVWKKIFGDSIRGSENYGGPLITSSGLLFIAGTKDKLLRVYDQHTGKLLRQLPLPAAAFATPATYRIDRKQYIVLPCGGTKLGAAKGESYVAFALDE